MGIAEMIQLKEENPSNIKQMDWKSFCDIKKKIKKNVVLVVDIDVYLQTSDLAGYEAAPHSDIVYENETSSWRKHQK